MVMRLCALVGALGLAALPAQDLVFSLASDIAATPVPFASTEVHRLGPAGLPHAFLPREALNVLFGDRDGNGILDDAPTNVDAFHALGPGGVTSWLFSVTANTPLTNGTTLLDGDIFQFDGQGGIQVAYAEDLFAQATGTSAVDVDGLAIGPAGEIWFSFAEDEATTSATLTAQNGGQAVLDEQTIFRIDAGQSVAVIHFTQAQVVGFFNQALGTSVTSVVDIVGLTPDPAGVPGDLLMTCASTSQALRGRIVSSAGGGRPLLVNGAPFDPGAMGFTSAPSFDALGFTVEPPHPVLRAIPDRGQSAAGGVGLLVVEGLAPGSAVQIIASEPVFPGPFAWQSSTTPGFGAVFPDPMQAFFYESLMAPAWRLVADAGGRAVYGFDFLGLPPDTRAVGQAVEVTTLALSSPVSVAILP